MDDILHCMENIKELLSVCDLPDDGLWCALFLNSGVHSKPAKFTVSAENNSAFSLNALAIAQKK